MKDEVERLSIIINDLILKMSYPGGSCPDSPNVNDDLLTGNIKMMKLMIFILEELYRLKLDK